MKKEESKIYQCTASEIRNRLNGRKYRIGLDLGVGSIGVGVVALEPDNNGDLYSTDIIFAASRVFPASAGAQDRREKRGQRNAIRHKVHRLEKLWKILACRELMLPFSTKQCPDPARLRFSEDEIRKDVYQLRLYGLSNKLTLGELGMVLYHIAGHRGSSSIRTFLDSPEADEKEAESLRQTESISQAEHLGTFIEVLFWSRRNVGTNFRNKLGYDERTPLPTRDIIENELDQLLSTQKSFYPDILDDEYVQQIKDCILFENEKLVPEVDNCPYFPSEKKIPKAAFINEERRLWEAVNNVRIIEEIQVGDLFKDIRKSLNPGEKKALYEVLRSGKNIGVPEFKKIFPHYAVCKKVVLQGVDKKMPRLSGFRFKELENAPWFSKMSEEMQMAFLYRYLNCPDDKKLRNILKDEFSMTDSEVDHALSIKLIDGYAPVGLSAMKIIMQYIIDEGLSYQEAESKAVEEGNLENEISDMVYDRLPYYGMVIPSSTQSIAGKAWHSVFADKRGKKGFIIPCTNKDEEKYGRIANPVVHQTLNELRKVVNELIDLFGAKPASICVEVARDLKVGKEKRDEISRDISRNEKENKRLFNEFCKPNGLGKKYIRHFKLLEEQQYKCPYCLGTINVADIVASRVDIDHIYPKDDTGDSSLNNLVLAHKTCNETKKAKRIPHEAFCTDVVLWRRIEQFVTSTLPEPKARRFQTTADEYDEYLVMHSFAPRFAPDNAYIARVACRYLQSLFIKEDRLKAVKTIRGGETAFLRRAWNLNGISNDLASAICNQTATEYLDKKNRTDFRHHALDALVAAMFTPNYSKVIETLVSNGHNLGEVIDRLPVPRFFRVDGEMSRNEQVESFSKEVEQFIFNKTFVSRKQKKSKNGELFKDSRYSVLAEGPDDVVLCKKIPLTKIDADCIEDAKGTKSLEKVLKGRFVFPAFLDNEGKSNILKYLDFNSGKYNQIVSLLPEAQAALDELNASLVEKGKKPKKIDDKTRVSWACGKIGGIYYQISNKKKNKVSIIPSMKSAFDTGDNYSLDLFIDSCGKMKGEVIRKVNAMNPAYVPRYRLDGYSLFERIYQKDVLEIDLVAGTGNGKKALSQSILTPNAPIGRTFIVIDTFTEVGNSIQVWYTPIVTTSENASSSFHVSGISKLNARKVVLSSLGILIYRSRLLRNKE